MLDSVPTFPQIPDHLDDTNFPVDLMIDIVYGTRAELIKFSSLMRELKKRKIPFRTVDTGDHDTGKLRRELNLPQPNYFLGKSWRDAWSNIPFPFAVILTLLWGAKTFFKLIGIFSTNAKIIVYHGNTKIVPLTVFAARSIFWKKFTLIHYESGLRGNTKNSFLFDFFSKVGDHYADILFVPTKSCEANLNKEHVNGMIVFTGSVMYEVVNHYLHPKRTFQSKSFVLINSSRSIQNKKDGIEFAKVVNELPLQSIVLLNPRMKRNLNKFGIMQKIDKKKTTLLYNLSYHDLLNAIKGSSLVLTDSEGMQEECSVLEKKCIITNDFIQLPELLDNGNAVVTGWNSQKILHIANSYMQNKSKIKLPYFYNDDATSRAVNVLETLV